MKSLSTVVSNVRVIQALVADAPVNFAVVAGAANLTWIEEATEAGTRYVVEFEDLATADPSQPIIRQLLAIAGDPQHAGFTQIWVITYPSQ